MYDLLYEVSCKTVVYFTEAPLTTSTVLNHVTAINMAAIYMYVCIYVCLQIYSADHTTSNYSSNPSTPVSSPPPMSGKNVSGNELGNH